MTPGSSVTFGGLQIDTDAHVLDTNDQPISGLYAAGEVAFTGLFLSLIHIYNLVRVTTCGVSGQLATDACYNDVNGYKTITDYWSADSVPTAYCSMHKSVSICTESGLLATDYCPSYSVESRGIVLIPRGHPLYDYIDTYGDTIRKYLGEFATLKSTNDIANHICQIHDAYTATQQLSLIHIAASAEVQI